MNGVNICPRLEVLQYAGVADNYGAKTFVKIAPSKGAITRERLKY